MTGRRFSVLAILAAFCWTGFYGQETYFITQEVTRKIIDGGSNESSERDLHEIYINENMFALISRDRRIIIDRSSAKILIVDEINHTFLETKSPFDPLNILTQVSALRLLEDKRAVAEATADREEAILGYPGRASFFRIEAVNPQQLSIRSTVAIPLELASMKQLIQDFWRIAFYSCSAEAIALFSGAGGIPLGYEIREEQRDKTVITSVEPKEIVKKKIPPALLNVAQGYHAKNKITYDDLTAGRLGEKPREYDAEESSVLEVIAKFRDGYGKRDVSRVEEWVAELMAEDVFILGTDGPWPGTWEWRGGRRAASEMFSRDWSRWGDVKIFEDELHVDVDGDAAWVVAFATVSRPGGDDDGSRKRSLARISEYTKEGWDSRRALYEIIADAAAVLAQYERDDHFITPLRTEFGLVKRNGRWRLKMIHFSHPARGFRSFRLLNSDPKLLENQ